MPAHFAFGFAAASLELPLPVLDEGLELPDDGLDESLDEEGLDEVLGEAELPEDEVSLGVLLMPPPAGAPADGLPLAPAPDVPEELSPEDEVPALAPPELLLDAPPAPCAHAVVAKATMAAVTAALMSFRFIFSSSRVGDEVDCPRGDARTMPSMRHCEKGPRQLFRYSEVRTH
ncbi:MAG TPA: hypothetical protein VKE95_22545 [Burkholderiales bacterium]|nr:hypothetical protein [Burkholderiales bacterium]